LGIGIFPTVKIVFGTIARILSQVMVLHRAPSHLA
jgi:hypothetical protein